MAADLVTIATTAVLTQFLGPSAKHLGEQALERGKQVAAKATAYLAAVGREPQPVEPKVLLPLVQAASLETDLTLVDLWAALLANAADPFQRAPVQVSFAEMLRQLTPTDAILLDKVAQATAQADPRIRTYTTARTTALQIELERMGLVDSNIAIDNLERLGLCRTHASEAQMQPADLSELLSGTSSLRQQRALGGSLNREQISITHLGLAFLAAVTPPTP